MDVVEFSQAIDRSIARHRAMRRARLIATVQTALAFGACIGALIAGAILEGWL